MSDLSLSAACRRAALTAIIGIGLVVPALAQTQQPNPAVQQFGPRVNKQNGQQQPTKQQAAQQQPKPDVIGTHGDWVLQCEHEAGDKVASNTTTETTTETKSDASADAKADAKPADDKRACGMVQTARNAERQNIALTLVLMSGTQQGKPVTMMRVMAPIGVFLPTGVALEIDGAAVGRVPFTRCLPQVCIAFAEATTQTIEKLKKGNKANFIISEAPGLNITLELSLKGFTAGFDALGKL